MLKRSLDITVSAVGLALLGLPFAGIALATQEDTFRTGLAPQPAL